MKAKLKLFSVLVSAPVWMRVANAQETPTADNSTVNVSTVANLKIPDGTVTVMVVVVAAAVMLCGMILIFRRLKEINQGFGANSLKAVGLVLFLPTLLIVSVTVADFKAETLAALLGTVAGYVLSQSKSDT